MDTKARPVYICLQKTHFKPRDTYKLKVGGWKRVFHGTRDQKKVDLFQSVSQSNGNKSKGKQMGPN